MIKFCYLQSAVKRRVTCNCGCKGTQKKERKRQRRSTAFALTANKTKTPAHRKDKSKDGHDLSELEVFQKKFFLIQRSMEIFFSYKQTFTILPPRKAGAFWPVCDYKECSF